MGETRSKRGRGEVRPATAVPKERKSAVSGRVRHGRKDDIDDGPVVPVAAATNEEEDLDANVVFVVGGEEEEEKDPAQDSPNS